MTDSTPRERMIADLRRMADYLEAHPELPVDNYDSAQVSHCVHAGSAAEKTAVIERVAADLGVEVDLIEGTDGVHHGAEFKIGRVKYRAFAIVPAAPVVDRTAARPPEPGEPVALQAEPREEASS